MKQIDDESGESLGPVSSTANIPACLTADGANQHLRQISDKYKEVVAYQLLCSFRVNGYKKGPESDQYNEFIDAIYLATQGDRAVSVVSEIPSTVLRTSASYDESDLSTCDEDSDADEDYEPPETMWQRPQETRSTFIASTHSRDGSILSAASTIQQQVEAQIYAEAFQHGVSVAPRLERPRRTTVPSVRELAQGNIMTSPKVRRHHASNGRCRLQVVDLTTEDEPETNGKRSITRNANNIIEIDSEDDDEVEEVRAGNRYQSVLSSLSDVVISPQQKIKRRTTVRQR